VIGKFIEGSPDCQERAEQAFRRALELQPGLSLAHKLYAQLEAETGQVQQALVRLLSEADRHGNDPELFAGLVHVCRYCGLFAQSMAAHEEARRLDPNVPTSVAQTLLLSGDPRLLEAGATHVGSADDSIRAIALGLAGRRDEALRALHDLRRASAIPTFHVWADSLVAWLERRPVDIVANAQSLGDIKIMEDPEALFEQGWLLCDAGDYENGLDFVRRGVAKGYCVADTLARNPQFDHLRGDPAFQEVLAAAEAGRREALAAFRENGGERLLGR
jgi:tetratricopeptide (TPR) repeat protein